MQMSTAGIIRSSRLVHSDISISKALQMLPVYTIDPPFKGASITPHVSEPMGQCECMSVS